MGLFSSKSSTVQTTQVTTVMPTATQGSIAAGGDVQVLDQGAIEQAFTFARKVYEQSGADFQSALDATIGYAKYGMDKSQAQAEMIAMAYQTAAQKETPLDYTTVVMALAVIAGAVLVFRKRVKMKG